MYRHMYIYIRDIYIYIHTLNFREGVQLTKNAEFYSTSFRQRLSSGVMSFLSSIGIFKFDVSFTVALT